MTWHLNIYQTASRAVLFFTMCEAHGEQFVNAWLPPVTDISREEEQAVVSSKSSGCTSAETIRSALMEDLPAHPL